MSKFAILVLLALTILVYGCSNPPPNAITTNTSGNWEAQFTQLSLGAEQAPYLNFVANFNVSNTTGETAQGLNFTGFSFINDGPCFLTGITATSQGGSATITTLSTSQVTGGMSITITSNAGTGTQEGSTLQMTALPPGGVTGTSSGTTATSGTLSNGVVVGTWSLSSTVAANQAMCGNPTTPIQGSFIMCQNSTTCVNPQ